MTDISSSRRSSTEEVQKSINGALQKYGRYSPSSGLGEFARDEARRLQALEESRQRENSRVVPRWQKEGVAGSLARAWKVTLGRWGEDWVFLALLGILMALLSYAMDEVVAQTFKFRLWLYDFASIHVGLQYLAWISIPVTLMVAAALLVGKTAPQAAGSGLPELKAIMRGTALDGFFDFKTLIAKIVGITSVLGCGMPLGREGSLIHISSILATMLSKFVGSLDSLREVFGSGAEWRNRDMLAAACAVGVATTFASPIGGVLFSIEVTSVYFAVRNYWRGFFAAVCGAAIFRLLAVWFQREDTVVAIYLTNFSMDFPFDPQELFVYALIGVISGFGAALYVWMHRKCITFVRTNPIIQKYIYVFVAVTVLLTVSLTFPAGLGQYMGGDIYTVDQVKALFRNFTWTNTNLTEPELDVLKHWNVNELGVFSSLGIYIVFTWLFSILCSSMPVPLGNFGPVFKMGAAIGRLVGELVSVYAPSGFRYGKILDPVIPGSYATVGAAAFSGAVTHTISTSVIVFEMTGQVTHTFPVMIGVLIANGICTLLQPSIYDSLILIKKLPYLPHLYPTSHSYLIHVKDFMVRNVCYIWHGITYGELLDTLNQNQTLKSLPLVNSPDTMILLGTVRRHELTRLIEQHLGDERRLYVAAQRKIELKDRFRRDSHPKMGDFDKNEKMKHTSHEDMLIASFILPTPPKNSDAGVFNPVLGDEPNSFSRRLRKSNSFSLSILPVVNEPQGSADNPAYEPSEQTSRDTIRRSSSAIFSGGQYNVSSDPDPKSFDFHDTNSTLHSLHESIESVNLAAPLSVDMSPDERRRWEAAELRRVAALGMCAVDPAPCQLVVTTPLPRAHSLFCLLGVRKAYVTLVGRLVGIVALAELRKATEDSNAGVLPQHLQPAKVNESGAINRAI